MSAYVICSKCGKPVRVSVSRCGWCGKRLTAARQGQRTAFSRAQ